MLATNNNTFVIGELEPYEVLAAIINLRAVCAPKTWRTEYGLIVDGTDGLRVNRSIFFEAAYLRQDMLGSDRVNRQIQQRLGLPVRFEFRDEELMLVVDECSDEVSLVGVAHAAIDHLQTTGRVDAQNSHYGIELRRMSVMDPNHYQRTIAAPVAYDFRRSCGFGIVWCMALFLGLVLLRALLPRSVSFWYIDELALIAVALSAVYNCYYYLFPGTQAETTAT